MDLHLADWEKDLQMFSRYFYSHPLNIEKHSETEVGKGDGSFGFYSHSTLPNCLLNESMGRKALGSSAVLSNLQAGGASAARPRAITIFCWNCIIHIQAALS